MRIIPIIVLEQSMQILNLVRKYYFVNGCINLLNKILYSILICNLMRTNEIILIYL